MPRFVVLSMVTLIMVITLNATTTTERRFANYRKIEAYEVRPGVLMMPQYTSDGRVCEIGLERLLYTPAMIRLNSGLSREEIYGMLDELVPGDERGQRSKDFPRDLIMQSGQGLITNIEYENVSIQIYGATLPAKQKNETVVNEVVATVKWKQRTCQ